MSAGNYPRTADEVNIKVGTTLTQLRQVYEALARHQRYFAAGVDLKLLEGWKEGQEGINDEQNLKTAVATAYTALEEFDWTFVERVEGLG